MSANNSDSFLDWKELNQGLLGDFWMTATYADVVSWFSKAGNVSDLFCLFIFCFVILPLVLPIAVDRSRHHI